MANPPRKSPRNAPQARPTAPRFADLRRVLPVGCCQSAAWKHFRSAQVEFLTGMQVLVHDSLEWMKLSKERDRELRRIPVQE